MSAPALHWQTLLGFPTGYATSAGGLLRALDARGVPVTYEYVYGPGSPFPPPEPRPLPESDLEAIARRPHAARPAVSVVYGVAPVFPRNRGRYRVGYTMLEVDRFPEPWLRAIGWVDEVWVPSRFNRDALLAQGVTRPVHVLPLGVDPERFRPDGPRCRPPGGEVVFLASFEWSERKQPGLLLTVFNQTFHRGEGAILLCKVIGSGGPTALKRRLAALPLKKTGGRIAFLGRDLPHAQLGALYRSADAYVSASRGEGWDLALTEAMACGLPVIAPRWGAPAEYLGEETGYVVDLRGTVPAVSTQTAHAAGSWADPDPDHLSALLRRVYEKRDEARATGQRAAQAVRSRLTWAHAAERIATRVAAIGA